MAQTYDTFWQQRYARYLNELIAAQVDNVASGNAIDHAEYKAMAGIIRGLRSALDAIDTVNDEIRKAEQGSK